MRYFSKTRKIVVVSLFAALMCIIAPITFPIGLVPISFATFVLHLSSVVLGKTSVVVVAVYILIGAIGLPVFSGGLGGLERVIGPTGGFILGYVPCALIAGVFADRFTRKRLISSIGMALGTVVLYATGTAWFCMVTGNNVLTAVTVCVLPFIPCDVIKIMAAMVMGGLISRRIKFRMCT